MATVTIRILEGLERGRTYPALTTPVTIGREDDNDIQLNDDRVSRFHVKLQDDGGRVILTDLESTNGTRVNGHPVHMKVLQVGDLLMIGRCVLLFGDLPHWEPLLNSSQELGANQTAHLDEEELANESSDLDFLGDHSRASPDVLFPQGPPPIPQGLKPLHCAQVSDVLAYLHEQVGLVLINTAERPKDAAGRREMVCEKDAWERLVNLQATLAGYLRGLSNPD